MDDRAVQMVFRTARNRNEVDLTLDIFEISPFDEGEIEKLHKEMMGEALALRAITEDDLQEIYRECVHLLEDDYRSAGGDRSS